MPVFPCPAESSAWRMARTRPSIMSLGATKSVPAAACKAAISPSTVTVASLSTSWPSAVSRPSCPWLVYGSRAMSVKSTNSGTAALIARTARSTRQSGFSASRPSGVLSSLGVTGKRATPRMPSSKSARASRTRSLRLSRKTPGMDAIGVGAAVPSWTNKGAMKSDGWSRTSCTISRMAAPRRNRRARRAGNPAELMASEWGIVCRDTNRVPDGRSEVDPVREGFPNQVQWIACRRIATVHGQDRPGASRPTCRHPASGLS